MSRERRVAFYAAVCFLSGCAGNGEGLDENGRPEGADDGPLRANLQSIQDNVFTPMCTGCHAGAAAPRGLRLDQDSSYAMLVNAPSAEVPSLNRVTPGDPDASYLIQKLEGRAAVGAQMPLGLPALPQSTIDVIREWIENGAMAASSGPPAVIPMQLHAVSAPSNAVPTELLIQADGELRVSTLNSESVRLIKSGGDGTFEDGNEISLSALDLQVRSLDPTVLAIRIENGTWAADSYRLTISSPDAARVLDNGGLPVGELTLQFEVGEMP